MCHPEERSAEGPTRPASGRPRASHSRSLGRFASLATTVLAACAAPGAGTTAYVGATVFDGTGRVIPNAVIVESGGHIIRLAPRDSVDVPRGATVVSLTGKWVIPGLIDGHAHASEWTLSRYLAYGVTSVRHVGGNLDRLTAL